jgi:hypothetical protein
MDKLGFEGGAHVEGIRTVVAGCHFTVNSIPCNQPPASHWDAGCVHEHITPDIGLCAAHEGQIKTPWYCLDCDRDQREPHKCVTAFTRRTA